MIKNVKISVIAQDGATAKVKHVAIDIQKAHELLAHKAISDDAKALLNTLEHIVGGHPDAHKVFISPESEADKNEPTYLLTKSQAD